MMAAQCSKRKAKRPKRISPGWLPGHASVLCHAYDDGLRGKSPTLSKLQLGAYGSVRRMSCAVLRYLPKLLVHMLKLKQLLPGEIGSFKNEGTSVTDLQYP